MCTLTETISIVYVMGRSSRSALEMVRSMCLQRRLMQERRSTATECMCGLGCATGHHWDACRAAGFNGSKSLLFEAFLGWKVRAAAAVTTWVEVFPSHHENTRVLV